MKIELVFEILHYEDDLLVDDADYLSDDHSGNRNKMEIATTASITDRDYTARSCHVTFNRNMNMGLLESAKEHE